MSLNTGIGDANTGEDSSVSPDANGQDSSTAQQTQDANDQQQTAGDSDADSSVASTGEVTQSADDQQNSQQQQQDGTTAIVDKPEDKDLEFHQHPRFQELVKEKNDVKAENETLRGHAARAQALDSFLTTNAIQAQELTQALEYLRLRRSDPAKAYELVRQDYEALAGYVGERLPADLEAEVASGVMPAERAKELAKMRAASTHAQWQNQSFTQQQQMQRETMIQGSIDQWARSRMSQDPDFRPKQDPAAVDGKWEYVDHLLRSVRQQKPPQTAQEAIQQVEQVYAQANKLFTSLRGTPAAVKRPLKSANSGTGTNAVVKTAEDVTRAILSGKRPHQLKYS